MAIRMIMCVVQIVLAGASLVGILLHEFLVVIWVVSVVATVLVCAGPAMLAAAHLRFQSKKPRDDSSMPRSRVIYPPELLDPRLKPMMATAPLTVGAWASDASANRRINGVVMGL